MLSDRRDKEKGGDSCTKMLPAGERKYYSDRTDGKGKRIKRCRVKKVPMGLVGG